jgi:polyhydroxybutyrate depolymerase
MASQFGCDDSGSVAAVAAISGLRLPAPCPGTRAVPVIAFHGKADPVDPYDGNGQPYWTYSVPDAAIKWAEHDSCAAQPANASPADGVQLSIYTGCQNGAAVDLYSIAGAGHTWPGGPPLPPGLEAALGPESSAVDANALIWTFFQHYHLP